MPNTMFVDKFYEMIPEFDQLLPRGTMLEDGMVVLIGDSIARANLRHLEKLESGERTHIHTSPEYERDKAREYNRWCTVSDIQIIPRWWTNEYGEVVGERSPMIAFVGTYGDGTKRKRNCDSDFPWLVKKDSLPGANSNLDMSVADFIFHTDEFPPDCEQ